MEENKTPTENTPIQGDFVQDFPSQTVFNKRVVHNFPLVIPRYDTAPTSAQKGEIALIGGLLKHASATDTWAGAGTKIASSIAEVSSGTVAEADLVSVTIPGGTLGTTGIVHLQGRFTVHGGSAQRFITIGVHYGSTTSIYSASTKVLGYDQKGRLDVYMFADNSAGAQKILCEAFCSEEDFSSTQMFRKSFTGTGGIDSSVDQTLRVSVAWDATTTAPANSASLSYVIVTKIQ